MDAQAYGAVTVNSLALPPEIRYSRSVALQLAPEIEAELIAAAAARGSSVDRVAREALELYQKFHSPGSRPPRHRATEIAWTRRPDARYRGEWVALEGEAVVAHGADNRAVYESARLQGFESPFLFFVDEPDASPAAGGWLPAEHD